MTTLNDADALYLGTNPASAAYVGTTKVWPPPVVLFRYAATNSTISNMADTQYMTGPPDDLFGYNTADSHFHQVGFKGDPTVPSNATITRVRIGCRYRINIEVIPSGAAIYMWWASGTDISNKLPTPKPTQSGVWYDAEITLTASNYTPAFLQNTAYMRIKGNGAPGAIWNIDSLWCEFTYTLP